MTPRRKWSAVYGKTPRRQLAGAAAVSSIFTHLQQHAGFLYQHMKMGLPDFDDLNYKMEARWHFWAREGNTPIVGFGGKLMQLLLTSDFTNWRVLIIRSLDSLEVIKEAILSPSPSKSKIPHWVRHFHGTCTICVFPIYYTRTCGKFQAMAFLSEGVQI